MSDKPELLFEMKGPNPMHDDAAECKRLRAMIRALIDSGATAKQIVMLTMAPSPDGADMPTLIVSTPSELPDEELAKVVGAGFCQFLQVLANRGAADDSDEESA